MNILIAEPLAPAGIELLQSQPGWNTIVSNPKEYAQHLATADALLVRSAVQVDKPVLEKAPKLRVIGRAGRAGDKPAGRQCIPGCRAHASLDAGDAPPHPAGQRLHARRQVGKEKIP